MCTETARMNAHRLFAIIRATWFEAQLEVCHSNNPCPFRASSVFIRGSF